MFLVFFVLWRLVGRQSTGQLSGQLRVACGATLVVLEKSYWLQLVDSCIVTEMYALPLGRRGAVLLSAAHGRGLPWTMRVLINLSDGTSRGPHACGGRGLTVFPEDHSCASWYSSLGAAAAWWCSGSVAQRLGGTTTLWLCGTGA